MNIIFYAGSLRPGGGLTVAKIMIEAMAEKKSNNILVYTGAKDCSLALRSTFEKYENVQEKQFFQGINSEIRYIISKLYFLHKTFLNRKQLLISINYYIPAFCKLFVYHLNLLSFMRQEGDKLPKKIKEFDAYLACRFATINVFESEYLKKTAEKYTGIEIKKNQLLYIGVDPEFFIEKKTNNNIHNTNILLVSSPQPYKDNPVCIDALYKLFKKSDSTNWRLTIVGGQSVEQWSALQTYAKDLGIEDNVAFLGPVDKQHLSTTMSQSLCLISASRIESFCMVALEAMASKCPAIVTNETSMPESVGDAATIVNAGNSSQFADAIYELYENKALRQKAVKKGLEHAKNFSNEKFKHDLTIIITKVFTL